MNAFILFIHCLLVCSLILLFLKQGKEALIAYLAVLAVSANLFVSKQITLFGLNVTCSDALAVGYLLGSNLIQEYFGKKEAKKTIWISFFVSVSFIALTYVHLSYTPSIYDTAHAHFQPLLKPIPRIVLASVFSFLVVQLLDYVFFNYLREKTRGKYLVVRVALSGLLAHGLDTLLFSFLGLYGLVHQIWDVIAFSFTVKILVIALATPFVFLTKRVVRVQV